MATKILMSAVRKLLVVAAGFAFGSGIASAAIVHLGYDPLFGGTFGNLAFSGQGDLNVDQACFASTGLVNANQVGGCGSVTFQDVTTTLTDGVPSETLTFAPPAPNPNPIGDVVIGVVLMNNMLVGFDTDIFGPQVAGPLAPDLPSGGNVWLQFVSGFDFISPGHFTVDPQAFIYIGDNCDTNPSGCSKSNGAGVTFSLTQFQTVPEPGTLPLILLAAGFAYVALRRVRGK